MTLIALYVAKNGIVFVSDTAKFDLYTNEFIKNGRKIYIYEGFSFSGKLNKKKKSSFVFAGAGTSPDQQKTKSYLKKAMGETGSLTSDPDLFDIRFSIFKNLYPFCYFFADGPSGEMAVKINGIGKKEGGNSHYNSAEITNKIGHIEITGSGEKFVDPCEIASISPSMDIDYGVKECIKLISNAEKRNPKLIRGVQVVTFTENGPEEVLYQED